MGLKIYLDHSDGKAYELLHELDNDLVTRVSLNGRQGEAGSMNVDPNEAEVVLRYEAVHRDGRPTLVDLESHQNRTLTGDEVQERIDTLAELPSNANVGPDTLFEASKRREQIAEDEARMDEARVNAEADRLAQLDHVQGTPVDSDETSSEGEETVDPSDDDGSGHSGDAEAGSTIGSGLSLGGSDPDAGSTTTEPADPTEADLAIQRAKENEA